MDTGFGRTTMVFATRFNRQPCAQPRAVLPLALAEDLTTDVRPMNKSLTGSQFRIELSPSRIELLEAVSSAVMPDQGWA
jgi:hypothetical protein